MDSPVYSHTPKFNTIRDWTTLFRAKAKGDSASSSSSHHYFVLNLSALTTQQQQQLYSIFLHIQNFLNGLKEKLTKSINTLHPSISNEDQQQTDAATFLKVLKSHVDSITGFMDESLESIGPKACETLTEVSQRVQALEKELEEAKVSARFYNAIFSALVMLVAALLAPISTLAVAPFLQRFDLVWNDVMEKPILLKLQVFQTILYSIHSAIFLAGKIQDTFHALRDMMTDLVYARPFLFVDNVLNSLEGKGKGKAVMGLSSSSSSFSPVVVNDSNDFSEMRDVKLEGKVVVVGKGKAVMGLSSSSSSSSPVVINDSNDFSEMKDVKLEGKVVVVDDSGALKDEGQLQGARFIGPPPLLEIGDATKRLSEVEKAMAAAMTQVEMAEYELSQLIQSLELTL